jgi:bifunctional non-homologous end joining protein LigD
LALTHLDRVFWPEPGLTKGDLVAYYRAVAPVLLPHLRGRPFTIKRHYTVPRGPFVWEKDAPAEMPPWIRTCELPARSRGGALVRYPLVNDERALLWMVDYGCIDLHVAAARCDRPDRPDYVVFDLDPAQGATFGDVVGAALLVRDALEALELESVVRTSGGEGLHVLVPIARRHSHEEAREFARIVAAAVARSRPSVVTVETAKERRRGVYVDTKMNGRAQQFVCVYSVRPVPAATVAAPLRWDELGPGLDPTAFTMHAVAGRVAAYGDLHAPLLGGRQRLDSALRKFSSRTA